MKYQKDQEDEKFVAMLSNEHMNQWLDRDNIKFSPNKKIDGGKQFKGCIYPLQIREKQTIW